MSSVTAVPNVNVRMGEIVVAREGTLSALLGSCVGVVLYDCRKSVCGLAHVVLPESRERAGPSGKYMDTAIESMIEQMGSKLRKGLVAKIAGGADMFQSNSEESIGAQNILAATSVLKDLEIPLAGSECGGERGRRIVLDVITGKVTVQQVGASEIVSL